MRTQKGGYPVNTEIMAQIIYYINNLAQTKIYLLSLMHKAVTVGHIVRIELTTLANNLRVSHVNHGFTIAIKSR